MDIEAVADVQGAAVLEGLGRRGPGRVVVAQEETACLLVADADHAWVEQRGRAGVVGVVVGVDQMRHLVARAVGGGDLVGDSEQVLLDAADVVALVVEGRAQR
jgi:hypothetical protein